MSTNNSSDKSLIALVKTGDEEAATVIYERYAKRIHGLVASKMSGRLSALVQPEDIVQSVFKSIFRGVSSGSYDAPKGGELWHLIAIVAIHKVRKNATRSNALRRDNRRTQPMDQSDDIDFLDRSTPEQFEVAIREATESLKPAEQSVVIYRVQGHSVEEISEKLGRSRRGIERLLQSAREKLSKLLSEENS